MIRKSFSLLLLPLLLMVGGAARSRQFATLGSNGSQVGSSGPACTPFIDNFTGAAGPLDSSSWTNYSGGGMQKDGSGNAVPIGGAGAAYITGCTFSATPYIQAKIVHGGGEGSYLGLGCTVSTGACGVGFLPGFGVLYTITGGWHFGTFIAACGGGSSGDVFRLSYNAVAYVVVDETTSTTLCTVVGGAPGGVPAITTATTGEPFSNVQAD